MARGGKRPGAGRPKKNREEQDFFEDAESYLEAVVMGKTAPDQVRVGAAKALLAYQLPKKRPKPKSPTPTKLRIKAEMHLDRDNLLNFEKKAKKIRKKYEVKK